MPLPQKLNVQKAFKQKMQGMSYQEIATAQGVAKQTVFDRISPILKELANPELIDQYRKNQSAILDGIAAKSVSHITDEKLANTNAKDLGILTAVMIDKSRLIQGQSTSNQAILLQAVFDTEDVE